MISSTNLAWAVPVVVGGLAVALLILADRRWSARQQELAQTASEIGLSFEPKAEELGTSDSVSFEEVKELNLLDLFLKNGQMNYLSNVMRGTKGVARLLIAQHSNGGGQNSAVLKAIVGFRFADAFFPRFTCARRPFSLDSLARPLV
jgi:hypothetical protein